MLILVVDVEDVFHVGVGVGFDLFCLFDYCIDLIWGFDVDLGFDFGFDVDIDVADWFNVV